MNNQPSSETAGAENEQQSIDRRLFLRSIGKWSGAAIAAVGVGGASLANAPEASAGIWINRWGAPRRGGWINRWAPSPRRGRRSKTGGRRRGGGVDWWYVGRWLNLRVRGSPAFAKATAVIWCGTATTSAP